MHKSLVAEAAAAQTQEQHGEVFALGAQLAVALDDLHLAAVHQPGAAGGHPGLADHLGDLGATGDGHLETLTVADRESGETEDVAAGWLFVFIGAAPGLTLDRQLFGWTVVGLTVLWTVLHIICVTRLRVSLNHRR